MLVVHQLIDGHHVEVRKIDTEVDDNDEKHSQDQGEREISLCVFNFPPEITDCTPTFITPEGRKQGGKHAFNENGIRPSVWNVMNRVSLNIAPTAMPYRKPKQDDHEQAGDHDVQNEFAEILAQFQTDIIDVRQADNQGDRQHLHAEIIKWSEETEDGHRRPVRG